MLETYERGRQFHRYGLSSVWFSRWVSPRGWAYMTDLSGLYHCWESKPAGDRHKGILERNHHWFLRFGFSVVLADFESSDSLENTASISSPSPCVGVIMLHVVNWKRNNSVCL